LHIFIDETGDTGFKLKKGSSDIFSITLIIFKNPLEIEKVTKSIKSLEDRLGFSQKSEWKFSKTAPKYRIEFLKTVCVYDFEIRAVVMIKKNISGPILTTNKDSFYNYTCKLVLQYSLKCMNEAKIIFDKRGNKEFYTHLRQYLRNKCNMNHEKIKEIKSKDSRKEKPLQVVDMIAGAIGRSFSGKKDSQDYIQLIEPKLKNMFRFPDDLKNK
jgi:hypothetical protein